MPAFPSMSPPPRREGLPVPTFFLLLPGRASSSAPSLGRLPWKAGRFCETRAGPCRQRWCLAETGLCSFP